MRQIVHPDHVAEPGDEGAIAIHEPVYPLTEGLTNARLSQLAAVALDRRPEIAEWIDAPRLASRNSIGRAPCRERVWQYVKILVVAVTLKKKKNKIKSKSI